MTIHTFWRLRRGLLGAAAAALCLTTTTALAGSGVGDVFNLGQTNTVDGTSTLSGTTAGPQLKVQNASTAANVFSIYGQITSTAPGAGATALRGQNNGTGTAGYGVYGSQAGQGIGVYGTAATGTGVGVSGRHLGSAGTGPGVKGQTASAAGAGVLGVNLAKGPGLQSLVNAGVAPLKVSSDTKVANLNADKVDGLDATSFWKLAGNAGTTPGTNFVGTTDAQSLVLKTNNSEAMRVNPSGWVGIGTAGPSAKLDVNGDAIHSTAAVTSEGFEAVTFPPGGWTTGGDA